MKNTYIKHRPSLPGLRRWFSWMALPFCVGGDVASADYASEILSENPISYYRFNDSVASGIDPTPAVNLGSLGASGNGTFNGVSTRGLAGAIAGDNCLTFSNPATASTAYIGSANIPNNAALNPSHTGTNPFTVELWVKPNTTTSTLLSPVSSMSFTTGRAGYLIYQNGATWQLRIGNKASATAAVLNGGTVTAGQWQHLAAVYTGGTNGVMTLFVDGVQVGTQTLTVPYEANDNAPFVIGATAAPGRTFDGAVDEVAFFSSALTGSRLASRVAERTANPAGYASHVTADSPVGYWRLNEAVFVPPVALNQGTLGAPANGTYYGDSKNTSTGPDNSGGFVGFGASNSSLVLASGNGHVGTTLGLLNNRSAYTVSGWVKRGAVKSTRGGYFGQNDLLEFGDANGGADIEAWINARGGNMVTPFSFPDDTWGFIVLTADTNSTTLYLNGVQVGQLTGSLANYGSNLFNFNIGGGGIFGSSGDYFRGEIDEVAVFDKALAANRVKQLYDSALGTVAPTADAPTVAPSNLVPEGGSYTLTANPAGTPPFDYQWYVDGVLIPGAESVSYTVPVAVAQDPVVDPFEYTVEITNSVTSITTAPAFVYVTPVLQWEGEDPLNPQFWDLGLSANWKPLSLSSTVTYSDDFSVLFDDTATTTVVDVREDVFPQSVVFDHSTKDYTLAGSLGDVGIGGTTGLTKSGTGTLTITASNIFTGPVVIDGGVVEISNGFNLGASPGSVTIDDAVLHATATLTLPRKISIPSTGEVVVDDGAIVTAPGGANGGGVLTKTGAGTLKFQSYGGGSFGGGIVVEAGTLEMAGGAFNSNLGITSIDVEPGAVLFQPSGSAHALGGGFSTVPVINLKTGATYTANQENYLGVTNLTGATVNGSGDLRTDYDFQLNVLASPVMTTWANPMNGVVTPISINVADGPGAVDFLVTGSIVNSQPLVKTGLGTMSIMGDGTISASSTIQAGTLTGSGSLAGALIVNAAATIAPGDPIGTFTAGDITLGGTYLCAISGAASDTLASRGNLVFSSGSSIQISATGATAPFYVICSYVGTLTNNGVNITGVPSGYEVVTGFNSVIIAQTGLNFAPTLAALPGPGSSFLSGNDFNSANGGFSVSAPVSAETDWTYSAGSWTSNGQGSAFGDTNLSYLSSPAFTLTKPGAFFLTFSHRYSFEAGYDGGWVEVSINGGPYQPVPASAFSFNGYSADFTDQAVAPLVNQRAFGGNSPGHPAFISSTCKAGDGNPGDLVTVRFMSASDNNTTGDLAPAGWQIDSYSFSQGGGMMLTWPIGIMQYSDNLEPPWTDISGTSPLLIDTSLAPKRFFRLKP